MNSAVRRNAIYIIAPLAFCLFLFLAHRALQDYHYADLIDGLIHIEVSHIILASLLCIINYLVLTLYDTLAFKYVKETLSYPKIAFASFVSYTFSHNIGFAALSGSATRLRFYTAWGLSPSAVARIVVFSGFHFWLGLLTLAVLTCFFDPQAWSDTLRIPLALIPHIGWVILLLVLGYLFLTTRSDKTFVVMGERLQLPTLSLTLKALSVACVDWLLAAGVLYSLLPDYQAVSFLYLVAAFVAGQFAGVLSNVPGGLGVFEVVVVLALGNRVPTSTLLAILVVYRAIYYLIPFFFGICAFAAFEYRKNMLFRKGLDRVETILATVVPNTLALGLFLAGVMLLFSGATPAFAPRLSFLSEILPIHLLETSHFINSLVGVGLIFLSWGLSRRLSAAYSASVLLLLCGIIVSLAKGFDFEEAFYLFLVLLGLLMGRRYFYRKSSILSALTPTSVLVSMAVLASSIWLGFFSYKHVEYSNDLWWEFAFDEDAPRFLRASIGACVLTMLISFRLLLRPRRPAFVKPTEEEIQLAAQIKSMARSTTGYLSLTGDKNLLFNSEKTAFLMYRVIRRSWICLGDPIGDPAAFSECIWSFRELCDQHDGRCAFYQVSKENLSLYVDAGLDLVKLGEEAMVELDQFSLTGGRSKSFRSTIRKLERDGYSFSVVPAEQVAPLLPELKEVSDEWLEDKNTREKGFSLGFFSPDYLTQCPLALVRKDDRIFAFANIWATETKEELSIDLMRHRNNAPNGMMDFLFIKLFDWGKSQGYKEFNLGMAPLSGFTTHKLAPLWNKFGAYIFRYGEHFYNFEGLRAYKEKFFPVWRPSYLAHSAGFMMPILLADTSSLIAHGFKGVVSK